VVTVGLTALLGACATPPKPPELEALEKLRNDPSAQAAAKKSPDLVGSADTWLGKARDKWQSNDLDEAAHAALMGQIKLKQAIALTDQDRAKSRLSSVGAEMEKANDEQARLQRELAAVNEQVTLLERLQQQGAERQKLEAQLSAEKKQLETERQRTTATEKVSDAEVALKNADAVNATKYAQVPYSSAKDMLARAQAEVQRNDFAAAQVSADMARKKAEEAIAASKPQYEEAAKSAESQARAEALAREAAALPYVTVRRDAKGTLQRLRVIVQSTNLFDRREAAVTGSGSAALDQIAGLIKKYPTFPVQVMGYTDSRGRASDQRTRAEARAQKIYSELLTRGVDAKRLVVTGEGSNEPLADSATANGRAQNNRVEIVFLYQ